MVKEAVAMELIKELKELADNLKISVNECEHVFVSAISEEKFSNRLAEVGKLSIENARQILEQTKLGEWDLSSAINYISAIIDENEIKKTLLDSINDSVFIIETDCSDTSHKIIQKWFAYESQNINIHEQPLFHLKTQNFGKMSLDFQNNYIWGIMGTIDNDMRFKYLSTLQSKLKKNKFINPD